MSTGNQSSYQDRFVAALLSRSADACPPEVTGKSVGRFRVYRNNVHGALIDALADAYPVCRRLVGDEFFTAMAREFFLLEKSRQPSLSLYGDGFAAFISDFEPAASVPYLSDVASLERARLEAVHAADAPALQATDLPVDGVELAGSRLAVHPAARTVTSQFPIFTIWHANQPGQTSQHTAFGAEHVLVTRPDDAIQLYLMDESNLLFLSVLSEGEPIQVAYETAINRFKDFDVVNSLSTLLGTGCFSRVIS